MTRWKCLVCACTLLGGLGSAVHAQPPRGSVVLRTMHDSTFHRERRVWVYTPAGYTRRGATYPLLLVFDGEDFNGTIGVPRILDSLVAAKSIPPVVAVMVDDSTGAVRIQELGNQPAFASFVARQLLPWVRTGWNVSVNPAHVVTVGSSAGALAAAYVAFSHPDLFGNVVSLSGAYWRGAAASNSAPWEWLTTQVARGAKRDVRFLLDVGTTETRGALGGAAPSILDANRHLRDALVGKGYEVRYTEVPGAAHRPEDWALQLPAALVWALGNR